MAAVGCGNGPSGSTTTLAIDCREAGNASEPRCTNGTTIPMVGTGPQFQDGNTGGFVDAAGGRLIVSGSVLYNTVHGGVIFAVDLATGNRTVVSATYNDPRDGMVMHGTGPDLGPTFEVRPAPDGHWYALSQPTGHTVQLLRIDPATGNRTMVFDDSASTCAFADGVWNINNGVPSGSIAVGADGTIYVATVGIQPPAMQGIDHGIAAIQPDGTCVILTMGSDATARTRGTGPNAGLDYTGLVLVANTLYALAGGGRVHAIDVATGNRHLVTSPQTADLVGTGPAAANDHLALANATTLWTTGPNNGRDPVSAFVAVDIASGDRTATSWESGPLGDFEHGDAWVAPHPTLAGVVIVVLSDDVILLETASGNNVRLSH